VAWKLKKCMDKVHVDVNECPCKAHTFVIQIPFCGEFHDAIFQTSSLIGLEDHMRMLISPAPSPTATVSRCPQCGAIMRIKIIEPDLKNPSNAQHVFECEECNLPRTYFIEAA
jgi:rRNA maturation protein Nop10